MSSIADGERSSTDLGTPGRYLASLWRLRHYLGNAVRLELLGRFRRTHLGLLYLILLPLAFALMFAWVLSKFSGQPFGKYVFYVYANQILWEFIVGAIAMGANSIVSAEGYIRVQRMPLLVFPIRLLLTLFVSMMIASSGVIILSALLMPGNLSVYTPLAYVNVFYIALCVAPFAVASGFFGLIFRDWQQLIGLIMQFAWFLSPVFFLPAVFERPDLAAWNAVNPIANAMELWRFPLIEGQLPSSNAFLVLGLWGLVGYVLASFLLVRLERRVLFYM